MSRRIVDSMNESNMLTLSEAIKTERLQEFIAQEEKRGIGPVERKKLDATIKLVATQPQPKDRTLRSTSRGGSRGK
jgi:hypothetical protein